MKEVMLEFRPIGFWTSPPLRHLWHLIATPDIHIPLPV